MQTDHDAEEETEDEGEGRADIEAEEEEEREKREEGEGEPSDGGSDIDDLTDLLERREWGEEPPEGQQGVRRRAGRGAGSQPAVRVALSAEGARERKEEGGGGGEREGGRPNGEKEEPDITIEEWEEKCKFWDSVDLEAEASDDLDIPTDKYIKGYKLMGAAGGGDTFVNRLFEKKLGEATKLGKLVEGYGDSQGCSLLFKYCIFPKLVYLARVMADRLHTDVWERVDKELGDSFARSMRLAPEE
uniref:Uncharacterized protein n=1 Tax=Chromera velia CCMP2878 TaxID=1169474 RepID=A0A0G4F4F6_9ALVE|eukprot:Cvel_164.t1-p1 / transcript=Cvel_164.t1 / gene=Cvel_164 / organism=Chromera_velia_CCMP2878 / gene_product=hypothetical protein / transcript_product=hypothetical protein / location=Cvel_scaffold10:143293-145455(+) / protein_length=244 / sequence_SO=supercontig / SO=protein_coding / is_pseudo=false